MIDIVAAANLAWRDYATDAVPSSGKHKPLKADIRGLFSAISANLSEKQDSYRNVTNPEIPGWGVSFNAPTAPGYSNGQSHTYTLTGASANPVNGILLNVIVESSYNKDIIGNIVSNPVAVGFNCEMQVNKANAGNDFWANLGLLDIQTPGSGNTAGQATAGILRGNWTGTNIAAGLRAQGENYSGRAGYGLIVSASLTEGTGSYFDNSFSTGVFVHMSKDYGVRVGGPQGAQNAMLPDAPFVFQTNDGSQDLWKISNNGGTSATMSMIGGFVLTSGSFPLIQKVNASAGADAKKWQEIVEPDGTWTLRSLNDAENAAADALKIKRTGNVPVGATFSTWVKPQSFTTAGLPSAATAGAGAVVFVSDAAGGPTLAVSDGSFFKLLAYR